MGIQKRNLMRTHRTWRPLQLQKTLGIAESTLRGSHAPVWSQTKIAQTPPHIERGRGIFVVIWIT